MDNVHCSLRPFYFVSKVLGTFAFSYKTSICGDGIRFTLAGIVWSLLSLGICLALLTLNLYAGERISSSSKILARAWESSLIIQFVVLLIAKIYQLVKQKSISNFLKLIDEFDGKVDIPMIGHF